MLILTRKTGEGVTLTVAPSATPTEIHLLLINRQNGHVKFGLDCDREQVHILRDELIGKDQQEEPVT